jgi:hypothetical protein
MAEPTMTTREVHEAVRSFFGNYDYPIFNSFIFDWESDFFAISKSGYSVEVEVKVSRQDFKKDFACKTAKHLIFTGHKRDQICVPHGGISVNRTYSPITRQIETSAEYSTIRYLKPCDKLPNKFFYACPEGLISPSEVPPYAGLIWTTKFGSTIVKPAPFLHKIKNNFDSILLGKYYHRNIEMKHLLFLYGRHNKLNDEQTKNLQNLINRMH